MNLGFFTMPIHPLEKDGGSSLQEDREAFVLADELGLPRPMLASMSPTRPRTLPPASRSSPGSRRTSRFKLAPAPSHANTHPAAIAASMGVLDTCSTGA